MSVLYEFAVLGAPTDAQINELRSLIEKSIEPFGLRLGHDVAWLDRPAKFIPDQLTASVAVFFGGVAAPAANVAELMRRAVPVIPVVSKLSKVPQEIPELLQSLNCLDLRSGGIQRVATAMLECVGLLPKQRRVFLSYRRDEATQVALQLFETLSAKLFDVFLDTHKIGVAEEFQAMLWHNLCDSDVLVMLDTKEYFGSRWTSAEFGRALAKGVSVLRIGWPGIKASRTTETAKHIELTPEQIDPDTGKLVDEVLDSICSTLESLRVESHATRNVTMVSKLRNDIEQIHGEIIGIGAHKAVQIRLANGSEVVVYPTVGIPTSTTLHDASTNSPDQTVAVLYDHIGIHRPWITHLEWLGSHIRPVRCVKLSEAAWEFADWRERS